MKFDSLESAWKFWLDYGCKVGFGVRKDYTNKNNKDKTVVASCTFICCKEGLRVKDKIDHLVVNQTAS